MKGCGGPALVKRGRPLQLVKAGCNPCQKGGRLQVVKCWGVRLSRGRGRQGGCNPCQEDCSVQGWGSNPCQEGARLQVVKGCGVQPLSRRGPACNPFERICWQKPPGARRAGWHGANRLALPRFRKCVFCHSLEPVVEPSAKTAGGFTKKTKNPGARSLEPQVLL